MNAFQLALSFTRIPRLFIRLLFWPLVLGVGIACVQIAATIVFVRTSTMTASELERSFTPERWQSGFLCQLIYGSSSDLGPLQICRWLPHEGGETAPSGCTLEDTDVVVRVSDPVSFRAQEYVELFQGATHRLHICRSCGTTIVIDTTSTPKTSRYYSARAFGVHFLRALVNPGTIPELVKVFEKSDNREELLGDVYFHSPGLTKPIPYSYFHELLAMTLNVTLLVVITLWLALKAHRQVLDYFARSDSLLPLVAACGKSQFYRALWIITIIRVSCFLVATVPIAYITHSVFISKDLLAVFTSSTAELLLWLIAITASLSVMAIIASVGELKHRHLRASFIYSYIPPLLWLFGTLVWIGTLLVPGRASDIFRLVITGTPVLGVSPIILGPVVCPHVLMLVTHTLLSALLVVIIAQKNTRWFAAHLEEL